VGDKLHLTETWEPGPPDLVTQGLTAPATTPDCPVGSASAHDLAAPDLRPGTHLRDSGPVDADVLVTAPRQHQIDVVGPPLGPYSWQHHLGQGDGLQALSLDREAHQARCPHGHTGVTWTPGRDVAGDPGGRIRFDQATWRACPARRVWTTAKNAPRHRTVRPQAHPEAIQAARLRQETPEFTAP